MRDFFDSKLYSIGSSIDITCLVYFLFISSIIAAILVDLPEPVGPDIITRPEFILAILLNEFGRSNSSIVFTLPIIFLITKPNFPLVINMLHLYLMGSISKEKSTSFLGKDRKSVV